MVYERLSSCHLVERDADHTGHRSSHIFTVQRLVTHTLSLCEAWEDMTVYIPWRKAKYSCRSVVCLFTFTTLFIAIIIDKPSYNFTLIRQWSTSEWAIPNSSQTLITHKRSTWKQPLWLGYGSLWERLAPTQQCSTICSQQHSIENIHLL